MTLENVNKAIEELESINPEEEYAYEKAVLAYLKINKLPVLLYDIPSNTTLFRARHHEKESLFEEVSEISITPPQFIKHFARCNRPFQPKFYCSENRPTSFMELVEYWASTRHYGDKIYVTIGMWVLKQPLTTIIVTTPDKRNRSFEFDIQHGAALDQFINSCEESVKEGTITLYRYLFEKFRKPAKNDLKTYLITTAYCNIALSYSNGQANAIFYPSVPFSGQGVNFAINSNFINPENIELTHAIRNKLVIGENENGNYTFQETESLRVKNIDNKRGTIEWENGSR